MKIKYSRLCYVDLHTRGSKLERTFLAHAQHFILSILTKNIALKITSEMQDLFRYQYFKKMKKQWTQFSPAFYP